MVAPGERDSGERLQPAAFVPERAWNGAYAESCSDNSSIMRLLRAC